MKRIEASIEIDAPVADVFAFTSDWQRWEDRWEGVSKFRPTTDVTRGDGTRYACKAWIAGMTFTLETEIHGFAENVAGRAAASWRQAMSRSRLFSGVPTLESQ